MKKLSLGLGLGLLALVYGGPTKSELTSSEAHWTSIEVYQCPEGAQVVEQCVTPQDMSETLEAGRTYLHRHSFEGASYLRAVLFWPSDSSSQPCLEKVKGECRLYGRWIAEKTFDLPINFPDPVAYRLEYHLLNSDKATIMADTTFNLNVEE